MADKEGFTLVKTKSALRRERKRLRGTVTYADATKNGASQHTAKANTKENNGSSREIRKLKSFPNDFVLFVHPNEGEHLTSKQVWERVTNTVDPMRDGLAIRGTRNLASGGILISAESEPDIAKLETKLGAADSNANLSVSRPVKRNPKIIIFGIDPTLEKEKLTEALCSQNDALNEASLELITEFQGKQGRTAIVSVDQKSIERLTGMRRLNIGWTRADFRPSTKPVLCYKCLKYGHVKKFCRSSALCGNCGTAGHEQKECTGNLSCPNCTHANLRSPFRKPLATDHKVGSRECPIHLREVERLKRQFHG